MLPLAIIVGYVPLADSGEWVLPDFDDGAVAMGTYRSLEPGTYKAMEGVLFGMNAGDYSAPNEVGNWYPKYEQEHDYMGSDGTFIGPYGMGIFAGFAIESDDLNGHSQGVPPSTALVQRD